MTPAASEVRCHVWRAGARAGEQRCTVCGAVCARSRAGKIEDYALPNTPAWVAPWLTWGSR